MGKQRTRPSLMRGLLYGLAFFLPGIYLAIHQAEVEAWLSGRGELPVISRVSRDLQTGMQVASGFFDEGYEDFYHRELPQLWEAITGSPLPAGRGLAGRWSNILSTSAGNPAPYHLWNRSFIEEKLGVAFKKRKRKSAQRFLDYIEAYLPLACNEMAMSGIPASITLAQGLLESDAGNGYLATVANNHFGIKCQKRPGYKKDGVIDDADYFPTSLAYDCELREDDNPWDRFEKYESAGHSYRRHTLLLMESGRYNWMLKKYRVGQYYRVDQKWFGVAQVPYYIAWSIGLKQSGYATSPRYAQKIAYLIETYELWRIDFGVIAAQDRQPDEKENDLTSSKNISPL